MSNLAPILLLGGAAFAVAASRKKKKRASTTSGKSAAELDAILDAMPDPDASGSKVVSTWLQRQQAMKFLAEYGICDSDPGAIDGKKGPQTTRAVEGFQECAGIEADGLWGEQTERAMLEMLRKLDREGLPTPKPGPAPAPEPSPSPSPSPDVKWTPDDVIVMDSQCDQMLHVADSLFQKQRKRAAEYALDGMTTFADAESIHQEMVEEYAPLCASLGKEGVGSGVRTWWGENTKWIYNVLREYEMLPNALEEDAEAFGLL